MGGSWTRSKTGRGPQPSSPSAPWLWCPAFCHHDRPLQKAPLGCVGPPTGNTSGHVPSLARAQVPERQEGGIFPANRSEPRPARAPIKGRCQRRVCTWETWRCREKAVPGGFQMDSGTEGSEPRCSSVRHPTDRPPCHQNSFTESGPDVEEKALEGKEETLLSPLRESRTQRRGRGRVVCVGGLEGGVGVRVVFGNRWQGASPSSREALRNGALTPRAQLAQVHLGPWLNRLC